jgi:hypothetical protein
LKVFAGKGDAAIRNREINEREPCVGDERQPTGCRITKIS